jgi:hypothetical protein
MHLLNTNRLLGNCAWCICISDVEYYISSSEIPECVVLNTDSQVTAVANNVTSLYQFHQKSYQCESGDLTPNNGAPN